jgi:hypothetical protein
METIRRPTKRPLNYERRRLGAAEGKGAVNMAVSKFIEESDIYQHRDETRSFILECFGKKEKKERQKREKGKSSMGRHTEIGGLSPFCTKTRFFLSVVFIHSIIHFH